MKLFKIFCIASFFLLGILSCEKDEHKIQPEDHLAGTWKLTEMYSEDGVISAYIIGMVRHIYYTLHGADYNTTTTFTTNPNEFTSTGTYNVVTNYLYWGSTPDTSLVSAPNSTGTWSIEGDTLTRIISGDTIVFTILELTGSKLTLRENVYQYTSYMHPVWPMDQEKRETVYTHYERQ